MQQIVLHREQSCMMTVGVFESMSYFLVYPFLAQIANLYYKERK
jgi:hypothetical protein